MALCSSCAAPLQERARYCAMCGRPVAIPAQPGPSILPANYPLPEANRTATNTGRWLQGLAIIGLAVLIVALAVNRFRPGGALSVPSLTGSESRLPSSLPLATPTPVLPNYEQLSIDVPAGGSYSLTFGRWQAGTVFEGYLLPTADHVGFRVQQPDGVDLVNLPIVGGRYDFHYTAPEAGQYVVTFGNSDGPLNGKQLTLVYRAYMLTTR